MAKKKKKQHRGHYCRICGDYKPNEKFGGRGHAKHICKECDALPQERKNELRYINLIDRAAWKYPRSRQDWELLEKMAKNKKYPEAMEYAQTILGSNQNQPLPEDKEDFDEWEDGNEGGGLLPNSLTFSDFDEDSQEEIRDAIREDVYDIICYEDGVVKEKSKQKVLKWITKNLYFGYDQKLILNEELDNLFDSILKEVMADLEKEDSEDL
ncbi:hypothetical protein FACS1894169_16160 [Bacteroidia bacterium]|nr:hypothetical protein FACS1894169_16160 [Bacteroidia bacterium]